MTLRRMANLVVATVLAAASLFAGIVPISVSINAGVPAGIVFLLGSGAIVAALGFGYVALWVVSRGRDG